MTARPIKNVLRLRTIGTCALAVLSVSTLLACTSTDSETMSERPLTTREAALLAEVLVRNHRAGGAVFSVTTLDRPGGSTVRLEGRLDWKNHIGEANLTVELGNAPVAIGWRRDVVLERWPQADEVLLGLGAAGSPVIVRPPNTTRRLDQIIAVLVGLAGERPDNAQLVLQTEGSAFLREDELRGRRVSVMRYGSRNVYWLDAETGEMVRFEARSLEGDLPILVDVIEHSTEAISLPGQETWLPIDAIAEYYIGLSPAV